VNVSSVHSTGEEYFPKLWPAVDVGLATCATLFLADNTNPVALIYEGPPASSKTTVADMFAGHPLCYRSDNFTPAAFVSHATALAVERRRDEHRPSRRNELAVTDRRLRAALRPADRRAGRGRHRQVHRRARHAQGRADRVSGYRRPVPGLTARLIAAASSTRPRAPSMKACVKPLRVSSLLLSFSPRLPASGSRGSPFYSRPFMARRQLLDPRTPYPFFGTRAGIIPMPLGARRAVRRSRPFPILSLIGLRYGRS